ncbi:MAG: transcription antitermination factor NusB [Solobacterium sp.]|nr:transcription antitermination factor NusB [Solobacterium sp.]
MTRHINREKAVIAVYQNQILPRPVEELIKDNFSDEEIEDTYILDVVRTACENTDRYHGYIDEVLEGWTFNRLGEIEQAILLCGCAEFDLKQVQAAVIIDEYVRLAKKYCEADSYKLINGVLDRI